jgi:alanine-glyoxylate transaminase/serine-glyoxylate transaminase/serine-pyruvate transaminase
MKMTELFGELNPSERILLGPGPSNVPPRVLKAMSTHCIGHLDPDFIRIMDETQELLRFIFQTENRLTIPISGTGSAGMETCFVNLVEPGDRVVIGVNGVFGTRMADNAQRLAMPNDLGPR